MTVSALRGVVVWKSDPPALRWHQRPKPEGFEHAAHFLGLECSPAQTRRLVSGLRHAPTVTRRAEDILKAARREPLPSDEPGVRREAIRARDGKRLRPVLLATLPDGRTEIADGEHRVSLAYHQNPQMPVAVVHAGGDTTTGAEMAKKKDKVQKVERAHARRAEALTELEKLAKREDLDVRTRESVRKSQRELQLAYLREVSPAGAAAWEQSMRAEGQWDGA